MVGEGTKRRLGQALWLSLVVIVISVWLWWTHHSANLFPVKAVKVNASFERISQQQIQQAVSPFVSHGFFAVDKNSLNERLLSLPWVARVEVKRLWPATVQLDITEQHAVAVWNKTHLINDKGYIFSPPLSSFPAQLPLMSGPKEAANDALDFLSQAELALAPLHLHITNLQIDKRHAFKLRLNNGIKLILGRTEVGVRLQRFIKAYPQVFAGRARYVDYVNLCYGHSMAVKWHNRGEVGNG